MRVKIRAARTVMHSKQTKNWYIYMYIRIELTIKRTCQNPSAQATNKFHSTLDFHFGLSLLVSCAPAMHHLRVYPYDYGGYKP